MRTEEGLSHLITPANAKACQLWKASALVSSSVIDAGGACFSGGELTTAAACKGHKSTASQDQARQSSTCNGTGDSDTVEHKGRVKGWRSGTANDVSADPQPIGLQKLISRPTLEVSKPGGGKVFPAARSASARRAIKNRRWRLSFRPAVRKSIDPPPNRTGL
jgi:hypothetical protein